MPRLTVFVSAGLAAGFAWACGESAGDGASDDTAEVPEGLPHDKDEAAEMAATGKADWSLDPCEWAGWYGDGECDTFCPKRDADCAPPRPAELTLLDRYTLPGDRLFPESLAYDADGEAFFTSSMTRGDLTRIASDGSIEVFHPGTGEKDRLTLGVKVDAARGRLLACSYLNVQPVTGRVWVFDLGTGEQSHDIDLTEVVAGASCNDLVVAPDGTVYVTDREKPNVYRIGGLTDSGQYTVELFATDPLLAKPRLGVGQNGAALTPDGRYLLTTQFLPPRLWRIDLADPRKVSKVELSGSHPLTEALSGADGIVWHGDALYVAFGSSLLRLRSRDDWRSAKYDRLPLGTKISAVTVAQDQLYVLKSDVAKFVLGGKPALPFEILRIDPAEFDAR